MIKQNTKRKIIASEIIATINYLNCEPKYMVYPIDDLQKFLIDIENIFSNDEREFDASFCSINAMQCYFPNSCNVNGNMLTIKTPEDRDAMRRFIIEDEDIIFYITERLKNGLFTSKV